MISRMKSSAEHHIVGILLAIATCLTIYLLLQPREESFPCYVVTHYVGSSIFTHYQLDAPIWTGTVLSLNDGTQLSGNLTIEQTQCTKGYLN